MIRSLSAIVATAVAAVVIAGCGGSGTPAASTAASGGAPASSNGGQQWMTDAAFTTVSGTPQTPVCNPGGLPDEDEETCQWFWNHMIAWQPLTNEAKGPVLDGAANGSMVYGGFRGDLDDTHWWGPDLPSVQFQGTTFSCEGTGGIKRNDGYCRDKWPGLQFGKSANVETFDSGTATKSTIIWRLSTGTTPEKRGGEWVPSRPDVRFGDEYFMAYNNGGADGNQYAFCSKRSGTASGEWVSCGRANDPDADGASINTTQPPGNDEDYASFGWVVETYPVLVRVANRLPDSRFAIENAGGSDIALSAQGSTKGALTGDAELLGPASPVLKVQVTGKGRVSTTSGASGPTINCGETATNCSRAVEAGVTVNLTATPTAGNAFAGWATDECAGSGAEGAECSFTMPPIDRTVCATFTPEGSPADAPANDPACGDAQKPDQGAAAEKSLWIAGYRKRTGEGRLQITGTLYGTTTSSKQSSFHKAPVTITVSFAKADKAPSCTVSSTSAGGGTAKCSVNSFQPGGRSTPGVLQVFIQQGSAG